jgi:hypothetical protein
MAPPTAAAKIAMTANMDDRITRSSVAGLMGLVIVYIAAWAASPLVLNHTASDLDLFFWPSAETAAAGHPLQMYSIGGVGGYPNANGPLGLLPLVPIAAIANAVGWANDFRLRAGLTNAVIAVVVLLLAITTLRIVERGRGAVSWRLATACVVLLAPALLVSLGDYGHVEQPLELWLILLGAGYALDERPVAAGLALGLAVLTRTTAVLYAIPLASFSLAVGRLKSAAVAPVVAAITVASGLAPFLLADGKDVVHALVTYRGDLPIAGGSIWLVARGGALEQLGQHGDAYLILAVAAALTALTIWRRSGAVTSVAGTFGILTVVATTFPMLAKTVYPYYLLEPYVFSTIWWLARSGTPVNWRALVPLILTAEVFLTKQGAVLPYTGLGLVEGIVSSAALGGVIALVMVDLFRAQPSAYAGYGQARGIA